MQRVKAKQFLFVVSCAGLLHAEPDWPQWGGPGRNFEAGDSKLADRWPEAGPRRLWKRALGDGYSAVAVSGDVLFTMFRRESREVAIALAADTGITLWEHAYEAPPREGTALEHGPGPHATPLVLGDRVITVGVTGVLNALDRKRGAVLWRHGLLSDLGGTNLYRGYSASPVAFGDSVLVTVGGKGQAVVAFGQKDGRVKWRREDFALSHASPLVIDFAGKKQLVVFGDEVTVGLDPGTGEKIWEHRHSISGGFIASMPVWGSDGRLVYSCAYDGGGWGLELIQTADGIQAKQTWFNKQLRVHHSNLVRAGDYVYASSGDFGPKIFTATNVKTGEFAWRKRVFTRCSLVYADGKCIVLEEDGKLSLARVSPQGVEILSQVQLFEARAWTPPTLVGNRLYVRNREEIFALELP
jgi:outer membrane protein assembly factor BamB